MVEKDEITDESTFWIFIICGAVGLIIIVALVILFCKIRKANKEIVSEVVELTP